VQYRNDLGSGGSWQSLTNVPTAGTTGPVDITDLNAGNSSTRFYRIVTPAIP